jgi:hypothetical protein
MTQMGYLVCQGCGCRTVTVPADKELHDWPCCETFADSKSPCRYAVIARCSSSIDYADAGLTANCITDTTRWFLMYPVFELRKRCPTGCEWVHQQICDSPGHDFNDGRLYDVYPNAINDPQAFPPAHNDPPLGYHPGDYRYETDGSCFATFSSDADNWVLSIPSVAAGSVTLTMVNSFVVAYAAYHGKTLPFYTNDNDWEPFGTNSPGTGYPQGNQMTIDPVGYADFPMLPKSICVVALDDPGTTANPCDDQESRCACCDFFGDQGQISLTITGCQSNGTQLLLLDRAVCATLPCGIPAHCPTTNPCKVFWGTFSLGETGCTGDDAQDWTGSASLLVWCEPGADPPYKAKAFCYDGNTNCWVFQGDVNIGDYMCDCGTPTLWVTLPTMDCCCPGDVVGPCCDYDSLPATGTISDGTLSYTITKGATPGGLTTYTIAVATLCGFLSTAISVTCDAGTWTFDGAEMPCVGTMTWDGDCDAIILTFDCFGCTITATI